MLKMFPTKEATLALIVEFKTVTAAFPEAPVLWNAAPRDAEFSAIVQFVIVNVACPSFAPELKMAPPKPLPLLPRKVQSRKVAEALPLTDPSLWMPTPLVAMLPSNVHLVNVTLPWSLLMPPPLVAVFPTSTTSVSVRVA